jgi:hypothetical protein
MTKRHHLEPVFVDTIPNSLEEGRIYISKRYRTAVHRCCCGCGLEVVTPINPAKWQLNEDGGKVSLRPSVGNWSFPCQSHYWIDHNRVRWAKAMPQWKIDHVRRRDQEAIELQTLPRPPANTPFTPANNRGAWWLRFARWLLGR